MKRLAPLLILTGCLHMIQSGRPYPTDKVCKPVHNVRVVLREGVDTWPAILTCEQARAAVDHALDLYALRGAWVVYFTMGYPALDVDNNLEARFPGAITNPPNAPYTIEINALAVAGLPHEFGHAWDFENHRPNQRDRE